MATPLLGLALPSDGTTNWGTLVNASVTALLDSAIAGTTPLAADGDVTLSTTAEAANQARQAVLLCTGSRSSVKKIIAPASSKTYVVINATSGAFGVTICGPGPTTGVTVPNGQAYLVAWNGTDFVAIKSTTINLNSTDVTGTLPIANGGTGQTTQQAALDALVGTQTANRVLRSNGTNSTLAQVALTTDVTGTLPVANGGTGLTSYTSGGVLHASGAGTLATGTGLVYSSTNLGVGVASPFYRLDVGVASGPFVASFKNSSTSANEANIMLWSQGEAGSAVGYIGTGGSAYAGAFSNKFVVGTQTAHALGFVASGSLRALIDAAGTFRVKGAGTAGSTDAVQFDVAAPANSLVLDSSGGVGIGLNTPSTYGKLAVLGTGSFTSALVSTSGSNAAKPTLEFRKTKYTGDSDINVLGRVSWRGYLGTSLEGEQAYITASSQNLLDVADNNTLKLAVTSLSASGVDVAAITLDSSGIDVNGGNSGRLTILNGTLTAKANTYVFQDNAGIVQYGRFDSNGNFIQRVNTTAASLTINQTMTASIVNNTTLKLSVRGTDGVTRSVNLTLS